MRRRSRVGGKPIKTRRRKAETPKRSRAPRVDGRRNSSSTSASTKNTLLARERDELLEQQQATADVLRVISSSPGDLKPVFAVILENATRLCQANFGLLWLCEGDAYRAVAMHNAPPAFAEVRQREPLVSMSGTTVLAQVARTRRTIQVADIAKDPAYQKNPRNTQLFVKLAGARSVVTVPMLKDNALIGAISIYRQEVRPFTDKQIELVQNFAAQAVIAIENTRLLNELRESLEQQTATSEVLSVISSSPGELTPVFDAMLANATKLCDASYGTLWLHEGHGRMRAAALHGRVPEAFLEKWGVGTEFRPSPAQPSARAMHSRIPVQLADLREDQSYIDGDALAVAAVQVAGVRSVISVPMVKDDVTVGTMTIYRREVRPFTDKQIALVTNFAAQAVIAIENTRLLNELHQSLEQQTATSEVLSVISTSPGELEPVFQAMLENAVHICGANFGNIYRWSGDALHLLATHNTPPAFAEARRNSPFCPGPDTPTGRMVATKGVIQVADLAAEPRFTEQDDRDVRFGVGVGGIRTLLSVPMLKEDELIGAITIYRQEVRPFTDKQIELVANFAAQAVIAIDNTRLLNELRQRTDDLSELLEQQTATSDVLRVISSSPGNLEPVFQAMLENAVRICDAKFGMLFRYDNEVYNPIAFYRLPSALDEYLRQRRGSFQPIPGSLLDRIRHTKKLCHTADYAAEAAPGRAATLGGARSTVDVPMLKDDALIGVISVYRQEVRPFTDKQIALVQNFAAQAVIAIENTRLLNELRESLQQQTATSEVLKVISSSPGELEPVFQAMLENATRICEAKFGTLFRFDGKNLHPAAHFGTPPELVEFQMRRGPYQPIPGSLLERVVTDEADKPHR